MDYNFVNARDFHSDSMEQPSLRFETFSKMCFLKWIYLEFIFFMFKKQFLDFFFFIDPG